MQKKIDEEVGQIINLGSLKDVPQNVSYLGIFPFDSLEPAKIDILWNSKSKHLSITNYQPQEYYENYLMTTTYSPAIQKLQEEQVRKLIKFSAGNSQELSLVEIGCGDGSFLNHAKRFFSEVIGIEPSQKFARLARQEGHVVIEAYVQKSQLPTTKKFDLFVARQVFEHLSDPLDCLLGVKKMLKVGAVGLIEVPNGFRALKEGRYFEFFPDHVNYFSVNSLVDLVSTAGLNVISCNESFGGDYLEAWISLDPEPTKMYEGLLNHREKVINSLNVWLRAKGTENNNIIFGCGAKTLSTVALNPDFFSENFRYAVDSDPNKVAKYLPGTNIEILSINDPLLVEPYNVLILALSYVDEIATMIRAKIPSALEVVTLAKNMDVILL